MTSSRPRPAFTPSQPRRAPGYRQPRGWAATERRIRTRDRETCHVCGKPGARTVDHLTPVAEGGSHDDANLACIHPQPCHAAKTEAERRRAITRTARRRPTRPNPNRLT